MNIENLDLEFKPNTEVLEQIMFNYHLLRRINLIAKTGNKADKIRMSVSCLNFLKFSIISIRLGGFNLFVKLNLRTEMREAYNIH